MSQQENCNSRNIPLPIQREVRQRCGFGCVICGLPLYEYEHMMEWAEVKRHMAEEITLLCDQHHREKTAGLLPKDKVIKANSNPFNLRKGVSKPYNLYFSGNHAEVEIGNNIFTCEDHGYGTQMIPLIVDNTPLIGIILADGHFLLNVVLFDEHNNIILRIKNNQLLYSTNPWDIQLVGTKLTIREAQRKILIEIIFEPPNKIKIQKGKFLCNGVEILIRPENILITNNSIIVSKCSAINCHGGLIIGEQSENIGGFMKIDGINRYLGDNKEALAYEKRMMKK